MTMNKLKAALKKQKMKQHIKKYQNTHNKYEDDDDGSISSDDVDTLEEDYIGKIIEGQYIIIKYIGRGTFSRVWLSYDFINKKYIIFKAYFQDEEEEFKYELSALNDIRNKNLLYNLRYNASLSYCFENSKTPNNCLLLPFKGLSISDIQDRCSDFDLRDVKHITKSILLSLDELHNIGYLHTDLKLDNILSDFYSYSTSKFVGWFNNLNIGDQYQKLLELNIPKDFSTFNKNKKRAQKRRARHKTTTAISIFVKKKINQYYHSDDEDDDADEDNADVDNEDNEDEKDNDEDDEDDPYQNVDITKINFVLSDYSNASKISEIDPDEEYQIRAFRAPENVIGHTYNYKSELWTVGCIIWYLFTREYIFEPELEGDNIKRDREQLSLMEQYLGRIPKEVSERSERYYELFDDSGKIKKHKKINPINLEGQLKTLRNDLSVEEVESVCHFLRKIWNYNTKTRITIKEALRDEFLN